MNITKFGLSNFRIFKEHFDFDLAPIMVLTGPNNSGKSSLSKALLLLKENEKIINSDSHYRTTTNLNYFKGEHDLGNHKYVVNTEIEETVFSFTFFQDYKFCVMIDNNAKFDWDYLITTKDNELVIGQFGGVIKIDIWNLRQYFSDRIGYPECLDNLAQSENTNRTNANHLESSLLIKISHFVLCLGYIGKKIWSIEVDLGNSPIVLYREEPINEEEKLDRENFENIISSSAEKDDYYPFGKQEDLISLIETLVKIATLKFSGKIISPEFVEKIKFTEDEIQFLIPTIKSGFFSFPDLIYVKTIKEPLKRAYSSNDLSAFQFLINEQISQDIEQNDNPRAKMRMKNNEKPIKDDYWMDERSGAKKCYDLFTEKWLKEFEIGEELSYGYNKKNDIFFIKVDGKSLPEYGLGFGLIIHILLALSNEYLKYQRFSWDSKDSRDNDLKLIFPSTYIIEEPETGLHPAFQSKMAEMIVDIQKTFHVNLIIETHSEYFIRKLQYLTATNKLNPDEAIIYYFNNPKKVPVNEPQIKKITIDKDGSLSDNFGTGFIDEGTNLKFELLRQIKNQQN